MGDISPHFNRSEFKCPCCDFDTVDTETLRILEIVRVHYAKPVFITSGCRCLNHNTHIGGAPSSQHLKGRAVDFKVKDVEPSKVHEFLDNLFPNELGLGRANTFTHLDTRSNGPARWTY